MAANDVYGLRVQWRSNALNLTAENTFYYKANSNTILDTQEEDLVQAFVSDVRTDYAGLVSNLYFIERYLVKQMPANVIAYEESGGEFAGIGTGDPMPPQIAIVVSLRTATIGRRGRGRLFIPPSVESANTSQGLVSGSYIAQANLFMSDAILIGDGVTTSTYSLGVWSVADQVWREVTSYIPRNKWGTQRGRTR